MIVSATEMQRDFGKYLEIASTSEVTITKDGVPVARLLGVDETVNFLTDRLVGLLPQDVDENEL